MSAGLKRIFTALLLIATVLVAAGVLVMSNHVQAQAASTQSQHISSTVPTTSNAPMSSGATAIAGQTYDNKTRIFLAGASQIQGNAADMSESVVESKGLLYAPIDHEQRTAAFVGWTGTAPNGTLSIPSSVKIDGADYRVTAVLASLVYQSADAQTQSKIAAYDRVLAQDLSDGAAYVTRANAVASGIVAPDVVAIALPSTINYIDPAALLAYPNVAAFSTDDASSTFATNGTTIFDIHSGALVCVAPGVAGQVEIPANVKSIPVGIFSFSKSATSILVAGTVAINASDDEDDQVGTSALSGSFRSSQFLSSYAGILYSADQKTLIAAPAGIGSAVTISKDCTSIAEGAFFGCQSINTISVLGTVSSIASGSYDLQTLFENEATIIDSVIGFFSGNSQIALPAFTKSAIATTSIVLTAGNNAQASMSSWKAVGFSKISVVDSVGTTTTPDEHGPVEVVSGDVALDEGPEIPVIGGNGNEGITADPQDPDELLPVQKGVESTEGSFSFTVLDDLTLSVSWTGPQPEGVLEIPSSAKIGGVTYRVSMIEPGAFAGFDAISGVFVPNTVTTIGEGAFENASALEFVDLNDGQEVIGARAFANTSIHQIDIPSSVTAIGNRAFDGLDNLLVVVRSNNMQTANPFGDSTNVNLYVPYSESDQYGILTKADSPTCVTYRYGLRFADSSISTEARQPVNLFNEDGLFVEGAATVSYECINPSMVVDLETMTLMSPEAGSATLMMALSVPLPYPHVVDGVVSTSIELASDSVLVQVEDPASLDAPVDESSIEQEEVIPVEQYMSDQASESLVQHDAGEGVSYHTLKPGPQINGYFKNSTSASTTRTTTCTAVYFGKKSAYASMASGAFKSFAADEVGNGNIKVYLNGTTSSFKAYVLSEDDKPIRLNTNCNNMFYYLYAMSALNVSNVDNSIAETWNRAFCGTNAFRTADLTALLGPNTKDISELFYIASTSYRTGLTSFNFSALDGLDVETSRNMFYDNISLNSAVTLNNFRSGDASGMFQKCTGLNSAVTITNCDFGSARNMFNGCTGLNKAVRMVDNVMTDTAYMFSGCTANTVAPVITGLSTSNMQYMFNNNPKLTTISISLVESDQLVPIDYMFQTGTVLSSLTLENVNISTFEKQFYNCTALSTVVFNNCSIANATSFFGNVKGKSLSNVTLNNFTAGGAASLFNAHTTLKNVTLNNVSIDSANSLFSGCTGLLTANITGGRISGVDDGTGVKSYTLYRMFYNCTALTTAKIDGFDVSNVTNMYGVFQNCSKLSSLSLSGFDSSKATDMQYMFGTCSALPSFDFSVLDFSSNPAVDYMFLSCNALTKIEVPPISVRTATFMFTKCLGLKTVDIKGLDCPTANSFFEGCTAITDSEVVLSPTSPTMIVSNFFKGCTLLKTASLRASTTGTTFDITYFYTGCSVLNDATFDNITTENFSNTLASTAVTILTLKNIKTGSPTTIIAGPKAKLVTLNLENVVLSTGASAFSGATALVNVNFNNVSFSNEVASCSSMFSGDTALRNVSFVDFDTSNVNDMSSMFATTTSLTSIDIDTLDYSSYPSLANMFNKSGLTSITATKLKTANMTSMFTSCSTLKTVYLKGADPATETNFSTTFQLCSVLDTVTLENFKAYSGGGSTSSTFTRTGSVNLLTLKNITTSTLQGLCNTYYYTSSSTFTKGQIKNIRIEGLDCTGSSASAFSGFVGLQTCYVENATLNSINSFTDSCTAMTDFTFKNVTITGVYNSETNTYSEVAGFSSMFNKCTALQKVTFDGVYPYGTTNLANMFNGCTTITDVVFKKFDTSKVTDMYRMFYGCSNLANIDMTTISCDAIPRMEEMFMNCTKLTSIDLHDLKAGVCTNMFKGCTLLNTANLTNFQADYMTTMFIDDTALANIMIDGLVANNTSYRMFYGCTKLPNQTLKNVTSPDMRGMFQNCTGITKVEIDGLVTAQADDMFNGCTSITSVDVKGGDRSASTTMNRMFSGCTKLTTAHLDNFNGTAGSTTSGTFSSCNALNDVTITNCTSDSIGKLCSTYGSVADYGIAKEILIKDCIVTNGSSQFSNFKQTTKITFDNVTIDEVSSLFNGCVAVKTITLKGVNITGLSNGAGGYVAVTGFPSMFNSCTALESIVFDGVHANQLENLSSMFNGCSTLKSVSFNDFDMSHVTNMTSMFYNCVSLTDFDMGLLDFTMAPTMNTMFYGCTGLTTIDFKNINATSMTNMFQNCTNLVSVNIEGVNNPAITTMTSMFNTCTSLVSARIANFTASATADAGSVFTSCSNKQLVITWENIKTTTLRNLCSTYGATTSSGYGWAKEIILKNVNATGTSSAFTSYLLTQKFTFDRVTLDSVDSLFKGDTGMKEVSLRNVTITGLWNATTGKYDPVAGFLTMFNSCTAMEKVTFNGVYPNGLTNLSKMFEKCTALTDVTLIKFDTSEVTNMSYMFSECTSLTNIDMTAIDCSARPDMTRMFNGCTALASIDLNGIVASTTTYMFNGCTALTSADIRRMNSPIMSYMFTTCTRLADIKMDGVRSEDTTYMFQNCTGLKAIDVNNVQVTRTLNYMFTGCSNLASIKMTEITGGSMNYMFEKVCTTTGLAGVVSLKDIQTTTAATMFSNATLISEMTIDGIDTPVTSNMFINCTGMKKANVKGSNPGVQTTMLRMFNSCTGLNDVTLENFNGTVGSSTANYALFTACRNIVNMKLKNISSNYPKHMISTYDDTNKQYGYAKNITLEGFTSTVAFTGLFQDFTTTQTITCDNLSLSSFVNLFRNCTSLKSAKLAYTDMSRVTSMDSMFYNCPSLTSFDYGTMNTTKINSMAYMFQGCSSMTAFNFEGFDTSNVTSMRNMFYGCSSWNSYDDLVYFSTPKLANMYGMFQNCKALTQLDLSSFSTTSLTNLAYTFNGDSNLKTIYVSSNWNKNPGSSETFTGCSKLVGGNGTTYNSSNIAGTYARLDVPGTIGYFTLIFRSIVNGTTLNAAIKGIDSTTPYNVPNTSVEYIFFGTSEQYEEEIEGRPYVKLDTEGKGTVKLYRSRDGASVYIICDTDLKLNSDSAYAFSYLRALKRIEFGALDVAPVTSMAYMFNYCTSLTDLDISKFETANLTDTSYMFYNCTQLTNVEASALWSTSKVRTYTNMFQGANQLRGDNGTKMQDTPSYYNSLTYARLDVPSSPGFFSQKKYMLVDGRTFAARLKNTTYDSISSRPRQIYFGATSDYPTIASSNAPSPIDEAGEGTINLYSVKISGSAFSYYILSDHGIQANTDCSYMFCNMSYLNTLSFKNFYTDKVMNMSYMFANTVRGYSYQTYTLNASMFNTSNVINMSHMFENCVYLKSINVSNWDTSKVTTMERTFAGAFSDSSLPTIQLDLTSWSFKSCTTTREMFHGKGLKYYSGSSYSYTTTVYNTKLQTIKFNPDPEKLGGSKIEDMYGMFQELRGLTSLDLSSFDTSGAKNMGYMFYNDYSMTTCDVSSFKGNNVNNTSFMFWQCKALKDVNLSQFNTPKLATLERMFYYCSALRSVNLSMLNTKNVTTTTYMFYYCSTLQQLDLSSFDTPVLNNTSYMFRYCTALKTIFVSNAWNMDRVASSGYMFTNCTQLVGGNGTHCSVTFKVYDKTYAQIDSSTQKGYLTAAAFTLGDGPIVNAAMKDQPTYETMDSRVKKVIIGYMNNHDQDVVGLTPTPVDNLQAGTINLYRSKDGQTVYILSYSDINSSDNCARMFQNMQALESIEFENFSTPNLKNMYLMFSGCKSLQELDMADFVTKSVTDMRGLFEGCSSITTMYAGSGWVTTGLANAYYGSDMFKGCSDKLIGGAGTVWDAANTTYVMARVDRGGKPGYFTQITYNLKIGTTVNSMIKNAKSHTGSNTVVTKVIFDYYENQESRVSGLTAIAIDDADKGNISLYRSADNATVYILSQCGINANVDSSYMFYNLRSVTSFQFNNFGTRNTTNMTFMFCYDYAVTNLDLTTFTTNKVTDFSRMFQQCTALKTVNLSTFITSEATDMSYMFYRDAAITSLDVSRFGTPRVTTMANMFYGLSAVTQLDLSGMSTSQCTIMTNMFYNMTALRTIYANDGWDTTNVTTSSNMFYSCSKLVGGNGTKFVSSKRDKAYARVDATGTPGYFTYKSLSLLPGPELNAIMKNAYSYSETNTTIEKIVFGSPNDYPSALRLTDREAVDNSRSGLMMMYRQTSKVADPDADDGRTIDHVTIYILSDATISANIDSSYLFYDMRGLGSIVFENWDTKYVSDMSNMFAYDESLTDVDITTFTSVKTFNMASMFYNCKSLEELDFSTLDTSKVTDMTSMLRNCSNLHTVYAGSEWSTAAVSSSSNMFAGCTSIVGGNGTAFNSSYTNAGRARIDIPGTAGYYTMVTYDLAEGTVVNAAIKNALYTATNDKVTRIIFSYNINWENEIKGLTGVNVDAAGTGSIKLYRSTDGTIIYILSPCAIAANENSSYLFSGLTALTTFTMTNFSSSKATDLSSLFAGDTSLTSPPVTTINTSSATNLSKMFEGCTSLYGINMTAFKVENVETVAGMFKNCTALTSINTTNWKTESLTDMESMLEGCTAIRSFNVSKLDLSNVTNMARLFYGCTSFTTFTTRGVKTTELTNMNYMFFNCTAMTWLDLSDFDTHKVTDMAYTFYNCKKLVTILASGRWSNEAVTNMDFTFYLCEKIKGGNGTTYDITRTSAEFAKIDEENDPGYLTIGTVYLIPGPELNNEIADSTGTVRSVIFGLTDDYESRIQGLKGIPVDEDRTGIINLYASAGSVYILSNFYINTPDDASSIFDGLISLETIRFANFTCSSSKNFSNMFKNCASLKTLDLSSFNTSAATNMSGMFDGCVGLTGIDLSTIETPNVTTTARMFAGCSGLTELDISSFDTNKTTDMSYMFTGCTSLVTITGGAGWSTAAVTSSNNMFSDCVSVVGGHGTTFDPAYIDASRAVFDRTGHPGYLSMVRYKLLPGRELNAALKGASYTSADYTVSSITFGYLDENESIAAGRSWIAVDENRDGSIRLYKTNPSTAYILCATDIMTDEDGSYMFSNMRRLETINFDNFDTNALNDMSYMFNYCYRIQTLNLATFKTSKVTSFAYTFSNMYTTNYGLRNLNISSFDTSAATTMEYMFNGDQALTALDVSRFNTSNVTSMACMFQNVGAQIIDVSNFDTSKVETMYFMFYNASNVRELDVSSFNTSNVLDMRSMFRGCTALTSLDVHTFDTSNVTSMYYMFRDCQSLTELNVLNIDTSKVKDLSYLFYGCSAIELIDLSTFDTYAVTNMSYMFYGCSNLKTMYAGRLWSTGKVTSSVAMFEDCVEVVGECGTKYDENHIDKSYAIIDTLEKPGYLTLKGYKLLPGNELVAEMKQAAYDAVDSTVSKVVFAYNQDYPAIADGSGVAVDAARLGYVKLYRATEDGKTVLYILSDCEIRANPDSSYSFYSMAALKEIVFDNYNATYANNLNYMFAKCTGMTDMVFEGFDTLNATSMMSTFEGCTGLTTLDITDFNTQKVTDATTMFNGNSALKTIIVGGGWDVTKTSRTIGMFTGCNNIVGALGTTFNSSKTNGEYARIDGGATSPGYLTMTYYTLLDGDKFNETIKGQKFTFYDEKISSIVFGFTTDYPQITSSIKSIPVDSEEKGKIRAYTVENGGTGTTTVYVLSTCGIQTSADPSFMFYRTEKLANISLSNFKTSQAEDMTAMFSGCWGITSFDLASLDMAKVTNAHSMFADAVSLTSVNLAGNNANALEDISEMFAGCTSFTNMSLAGLNTSNVTTMAGLYMGCTSLKTASLGGIDTSKVTTFEQMFEGCESLTDPGLTGINTSESTNMSAMFSGCTALTSINLAALDTSKVERFDNMFEGCSALTTLDVTKLNTTSATSLAYLFSGCTSLPSIDLSAMDTSKVTQMNYMFYGCTALTQLNVRSMNVAKVANMEGMFGGLTGITVLDLSSFSTSKVTNMAYMFSGDNVLKTIYVGKGWSTASVVSSANMFADCVSIVGGNGTVYNAARINARYAVVDSLTSIGYLTVITYTLLPGPQLNAAIKGTDYTSNNSTIKKIVFGYTEDYVSASTASMSTVDSMESVSGTPIAVDANGLGDIKLYRSADGSIIHILCDYGIRLNPNSSYAFSRLTGITEFVFDNLDTSTGTNLSYMFSGDTKLASLDLTNFTTYLASNLSYMFSGDTKLASIYVGSNWAPELSLDTEAGGSSTDMFGGCSVLVGGHGTAVADLETYDATYAVADDKYGDIGTIGYMTGKTVVACFLNDVADPTVGEDGEEVSPPDPEVLQTTVMNVGGTPAYVKETPKSVKDPGLGRQYVFKGWSPAIAAQSGYVEYSPVYELQTCPVYTITFDPNGGTLSDLVDEETGEVIKPVTKLYYWENAGYSLIPNPASAEDLLAVGDMVTEIVPQWLGHDFDGYGLTSEDKFITLAGKLSKTAPAITSDQVWKANWVQAMIAGSVTIDNMNPVFGDLLTATISNIQSAAEPHYQWYRGDNPIVGAISSQYYLLPADVGHTIKCIVTDENGYFGGKLESDPTAEVGKAEWTTLSAEIIGTPAVGETLTIKYSNQPKYGTMVTSYKWKRSLIKNPTQPAIYLPMQDEVDQYYTVKASDLDYEIVCEITAINTCYNVNQPTVEAVKIGAGTFSATVIPSTYNPILGQPLSVTVSDASQGSAPTVFKWYRITDDGEELIAGANGSTYTPVSADIGHALVCAVEDASGCYLGQARSDQTNAVQKAVWEGMTADLAELPGIGRATTAVATGNIPAEGFTYTYEWFLDGSPISGETGATYTPKFSDYGHTLTAVVYGENDGYRSQAAQTPGYIVGQGDLTGTISLNPSVPRFWQPVSVDIADIAEGAVPTYQWYRRGSEGDVAIDGATGATYRPNRDDLGTILVAKLSDSAGYYIGEISAVADDVVTEPQTLTVALSSAEFVVGENVTATVTPPSGATSSTEYTYVWDYADDKDNGPWTRVSTSSDKQSVTDSLYMSPTVRGKYLRCTVYAPGVMGDVISTDKVGSKVLGGTVTLDRDPAVYKYAETITAAASGYQSDVDPVLTWYRDDSTDPIGSGATYTTGVADIGHVIKCVLTDGNDIRSGIVEADTQPIAKLEWNTMIVEISTLTGEDVGGTVKLGQTLKAQASGAPDDIADPDYHPGTLSYQWFVDGVAIAAPRGLGQTFVPEPTEYKQTITAVAVIANNTCYDIASATSAGAQVVQGDLAGKVQITGANSVGSTLYVNVTQISTGAEPSYQWMRDGMPIDGASSSSYLLTDDDHECSISVVVTDSSNGDDHYYAGSIQSDPTAKVGKTITIVWNAGEGEFEDGLKTITKSAVYASDAVLKATDQPQLPKREGYMLSGWIDSEGERIQFGKTVMPSSDATYTAMWIEMVDVDVPVSLTFNITSSGFVTTETGSLVSYMPESVGVIKLEAVSDADGFSTLFKDLDTNQVALTVAAPDYGATSVFLDEDPKDVAAISSGLVIGAYGTLNLNYGLIAPDITDHVYYSIDHAVKFADLIYTIAPSKYLL